jgi:hypothetical protein
LRLQELLLARPQELELPERELRLQGLQRVAAERKRLAQVFQQSCSD